MYRKEEVRYGYAPYAIQIGMPNRFYIPTRPGTFLLAPLGSTKFKEMEISITVGAALSDAAGATAAVLSMAVLEDSRGAASLNKRCPTKRYAMVN